MEATFLERLIGGFDEETTAKFINEFGLDVSGDERLLKDSIKAAERLQAGFNGSVNSYNQLLNDGIYISFDDYEHDTDARWFLISYINIGRDYLREGESL